MGSVPPVATHLTEPHNLMVTFKYHVPRNCSHCGEPKRVLVLDTETGKVYCFRCIGQSGVPVEVVPSNCTILPAGELNLSEEDCEFLKTMRIRA